MYFKADAITRRMSLYCHRISKKFRYYRAVAVQKLILQQFFYDLQRKRIKNFCCKARAVLSISVRTF